MDPSTHQRWLEYLELHQYFGDPRARRLDPETWVELDRELAVLTARDARGDASAAEVARLKALRRVLHRD